MALPFVAVAQTDDVGTGLLLDNTDAYSTVKLASPVTLKNRTALPRKLSLKQYCPTPQNQGLTSTCTGWASANARTIMLAKEKGWTDKAVITDNLLSPSFLYNQVPYSQTEPCRRGAYLNLVLEVLRDKGTVKMKDFPFDDSCNEKPTELQHKQAHEYKISNFVRLTFVENDQNIIHKIRLSLKEGMPVVVGMEILENFKRKKHPNSIWDPTLGNTRSVGGHAMVIVGYDNDKEAFELLNSWGTRWGNEGYLYIKYSDFKKYAKRVFQLRLDPNTRPEHTIKKETTLAAEINFTELATQHFEAGDGHDAGIYCTKEEKGTMEASLKDGTFIMNNENAAWTGYRVKVTTKAKDMNVYLVSYDNTKKTEILFPYSKEILSAYHGDTYTNKGTDTRKIRTDARIPYKEVEIAIPHEDECLQLDENNSTINCFLFSKTELNIDKIRSQIENGSGTFQERLTSVLGDKLEQTATIYEGNKMSFKAKVKASAIVPVIVDMNHVAE